IVPTHRAHIFDRSTNENLDNIAQNPRAAFMHAILDNFGEIKSSEGLNGPKMHRFEYIITLIAPLQEYFALLNIWLEGSQVPNTRFHLTTDDPVSLPLPDPRHLKLFAACARVIHLSGVAEHIDKMLYESEDADAVAFDGDSGEPLNYLLLRRSEHIR
ncbi:hypothetical protein DENSPDRAFT_777833, partial [Dentipellis sp. KUC8613]